MTTPSHLLLRRSLILSYAISRAACFQPDFLAQAIQAAQSANAGASLPVVDPSALITTAASAAKAAAAAPASVDEMLFAAANLLDSSRRVGLKSKSAAAQYYNYPELLNDSPTSVDRYDDDDDDDGATPRRISRTIALSPSERRVFDLLVAARNRYCPGTTIRVGGGWVRDKLLQQRQADLPCRDIDLGKPPLYAHHTVFSTR